MGQMAENKEERIVSGKPKEGDKALDKTLRPKRLSEYIGQDKVKENVKIAIEATKARKEASPPVGRPTPQQEQRAELG